MKRSSFMMEETCNDGVNVDQDIQQSVSHHLAALSQSSREFFLEGTAPLFIASHAGKRYDHVHQCKAAKGMVSADRTRQLLEQADCNNRWSAIEFPARALVAASPIFQQGYDADPAVSTIPLYLGIVLPGYAMCVLDWYGRALQSKVWYDFIPKDASIEGEDKFYWVYCYSAMRSLGMDDFAARLQSFIEGYIDSFVLNFESYEHLIRTLPESDPILGRLAEYTAHQMLTQTLRITQTECRLIAERFPTFAQKVNEDLNRQ